MATSVKPLPPPKPPSLVNLSHSAYRRNGKTTKSIKIDHKAIEELVLDELYYDIVHNLPADDIFMLMDQDKLLTLRQRDHYRMMKANHQPDVEKSEYLIECLRKGEPGFLQRLCTILKTLPPSSYIADKIQEKIKEMSSKPLIVLNPPRNTDGVSKGKSTVQWKIEYKKLEAKTRMQLQAKDREIKRLRKVVRQLELENYEHNDQLLSEMRALVDNVAKWIDLKSKAMPHSSSLIKLALNRERYHGDMYGSFDSQLSSTSEMSSTQSTMERHPMSKVSLESYLRDSICTPSSGESSTATPTQERKDQTLHDCSDLMIHMFLKNVSNPPSSLESDSSDIGRPQEEQSTLTPVSQRDCSESDIHLIAQPIPEAKPGTHSGSTYPGPSDHKSTLATTYYYAPSRDMNALSSTNGTNEAESFPRISTSASATGYEATTATQEPYFPSSGSEKVDRSSLYGNQTHHKFVQRKEPNYQQEQEPMNDLMTVFKRIQRKDFITNIA